MTITPSHICFKIFHLPNLPTTQEKRKESYDTFNDWLSKKLEVLQTPTVYIGSQDDYFKFQNEHHLLFPKGRFKWGELGIWASNLLAYQNFLKSSKDYLLLMEDDILVEHHEQFLALLVEALNLLPPDWEVFSFYAPENQFHKYRPSKGAEEDIVVPTYQDWSLLCYVVNRKTAKRLLTDTQKNGFSLALDHYLFKNTHDFNSYTLSPSAAKGCSRLELKSTFQENQSRVVFPRPSEKMEARWSDAYTPFEVSTYKTQMKNAIEKAPINFWEAIEGIMDTSKTTPESPSLGKVLVYKSYGGLGDIFFCIPAVYKLAAVSQQLDFAVAPRLVDFFLSHLTHVNVVDETWARQNEHSYDRHYELGNYPAFKGYQLPHALKYPTHKKVKQHSIQHYIDTVAKLHEDIDNHLEGYPYFKRKEDTSKPYFVVHHGAGFLLKIWPTEKYAQLIERLYELFPYLDCKIIKGPDDPDIEKHFTQPMPHVEMITGGMVEVGDTMAGALFHIGNDAGITHVAGAFNVPTVGIYGPTGPGSWGSFAQHNELIWGKKGVCNIRCNYDVILNCEHRICLTSVTVDRVLEALYKVLGNAYPANDFTIKCNPQAQFDFNKNDCLVQLGEQELLLEYHSPEMKAQMESLFKEEQLTDHPDFQMAVDVLVQQQILFKVPTFS